ncbi:permease prefix domain 1-containing protein [Rathayibacter soli]|uniref:permease prefix domain 1-containing protein n=1 Tax=Rathayibacter soli TaxID=3144168 RepID=UPI0027E56EAF|nr:permease prefix domain 1-containing protein [Glaciibacter superstes]
MSTADNTNIHRYLDEVFGTVTMTPELQDLKEELRSNLSARVNELTASGTDAPAAATRAIDELGDIRELIAEVDGSPQPTAVEHATGSARASSAGRPAISIQEAYRVYRVRPKPAFVVGIVIAAIATAVGLLLAALGAIGVLALPAGVVILMTGIAATGAAWLVGLSLVQETTTNHPMPSNRAGGYFFATLLTVFGLEIGGLIALGVIAIWAVVFASLGVVAGIVLFAFLGATQTNRKKPWAREFARQAQADDRFTQDPVAAARFGIYTAAIWILSFAAFVVLSMTVGFAWSWLALLAGLAIFFIVLARMLFPSHPTPTNEKSDN